MKLRFLSIIAGSLIVAACDTSSGSGQPVVDMAPTISVIGDRSIKANTTSDPIAFSVTDEQPDALEFSLMSDNAELVPVDGIAIGGNGASRMMTVTPVDDKIGDSMVTVMATDAGGLTTSTSFLLTIERERRSMQQFTRSTFAKSGDGDPELVNAVEFDRDAEQDDFADLVNP